MTEIPTQRRPVDRRRLMVLLLGGAGMALGGEALAQQARGRKPTAPARPAASQPAGATAAAARSFFTPAEFSLADELAEMIVPADEVSGGARAAQVTQYLDARLAESLDSELRQSWRDDLAEINRLSAALFGKAFLAASPAQRQQLLDRISRNEGKPKEPAEFAFATIKWQVTFVYYKTRIGIHDDLKYLGNVLLDEFVGTDPSRP